MALSSTLHFQAHLQFPQAKTHSKIANELSIPSRRESINRAILGIWVWPAGNMLYNALAAWWHGRYQGKVQFCILLIKNSAMQRQRHHTTGPFLRNLAWR